MKKCQFTQRLLALPFIGAVLIVVIFAGKRSLSLLPPRKKPKSQWFRHSCHMLSPYSTKCHRQATHRQSCALMAIVPPSYFLLGCLSLLDCWSSFRVNDFAFGWIDNWRHCWLASHLWCRAISFWQFFRRICTRLSRLGCQNLCLPQSNQRKAWVYKQRYIRSIVHRHLFCLWYQFFFSRNEKLTPLHSKSALAQAAP